MAPAIGATEYPTVLGTQTVAGPDIGPAGPGGTPSRFGLIPIGVSFVISGDCPIVRTDTSNIVKSSTNFFIGNFFKFY